MQLDKADYCLTLARLIHSIDEKNIGEILQNSSTEIVTTRCLHLITSLVLYKQILPEEYYHEIANRNLAIIIDMSKEGIKACYGSCNDRVV